MKLFRTLVMVSSLISISAQTYDSENCLRALHDANRIFEARAFCDTFINAATATGAIHTVAAEACSEDVGSRVSSACSCIFTSTSSPALVRGASMAEFEIRLKIMPLIVTI
jgi:hypothetical protein